MPLLKGILLAAGLLTLTFLSCKKSPAELGIEILPPSDTVGIKSVDTVTVYAYSMINDSVRTDESTAGLYGAIMDPVFGKTTASFYTQLCLSNEGVKFGTNPVLDSLILVLYYDGYSGDTTTLQRIRVYEMSQDIVYDSSYFSNQSVGTYDIELADQYFAPTPHDSVTVWGKKDAPHLRINLSAKTNYLGNKLLEAPQSILNSNAEFIKFMKGLYVKCEPVDSKGAFLHFTTSAPYSKMVVYFKNESSGDSLHYDFVINGTAARFTHFDHFGYLDASPAFRQQVINHDTNMGKDRLYLQAMAGVKIRLRLPYIRDLVKNGPIALNNAQLVFKNISNDTVYPPPATLYIYRLDSAGNFGILPDQTQSAAYFGGTYHASTRTYSFRITEYLQNLLLNDTIPNSDLYIYAGNPLKNVLETSRVILFGTQPYDPVQQQGRFQMKVVYTVLKPS
jgi:hypothetical protein